MTLPIKENLIHALFVMLTIFAVGFLGEKTNLPSLIAPFGASAFLVHFFPSSPVVRFRNLFFGYLICTFVGLVAGVFLPGSVMMIALAVGVSTLIMALTRTEHPPAAGIPILMIQSHAQWVFLITPVLVGVLVIAGIGYLRSIAKGLKA